MNYGDKVFVVTAKSVLEASIRHTISLKGVVTGYEVNFIDGRENNDPLPQFTKISRKDVFTDEEEANKALFKRKLKADTEITTPSADKTGDRRYIPGYKKRRY